MVVVRAHIFIHTHIYMYICSNSVHEKAYNL